MHHLFLSLSFFIIRTIISLLLLAHSKKRLLFNSLTQGCTTTYCFDRYWKNRRKTWRSLLNANYKILILNHPCHVEKTTTPQPNKKNIITNRYLILFTNGLMQWHVSLWNNTRGRFLTFILPEKWSWTNVFL